MMNRLPGNTGILLVLAVTLCLTRSASAGELASQVRDEWSVDPAYTDRIIEKTAFSQSLYGINWATWLVAATGFDGISEHLLNGDYHLAGSGAGKWILQEALLESIQDAIEFPTLAGHVVGLYELHLNLLRFSLEVEALRIQHNRYFAARPFNTYATIRDLEPFDLLDGVNMTKEGNGWLFTYSGYLSPLPSGNHLTPPRFFALAEHAWLMTHADSVAFSAESQQLRNLFSAKLAAALAEETVEVAALSDSSASIEWSCATGVTFHIEHSTDLERWTRSGPFVSGSNHFQTTLSALPPADARFFRIICDP